MKAFDELLLNPADLRFARAAQKLERYFKGTKARFAIVFWPDGMPTAWRAMAVVGSPDALADVPAALKTAVNHMPCKAQGGA